MWDCWGNAVRFLQTMLDPEPTSCRKVGDALFNRIYAVCHVGGINVNEALVRAGLALAYLDESDDNHVRRLDRSLAHGTRAR